MPLTLVIGNKAYSSWSMRPWFLLETLGVPFQEVVIPLYQDGSKPKLLSHAPTGKVPVLRDGGQTVWDTLSIAEYLAETFPDLPVWPRDKAARALARSLCAEMHSSYQALRQQCPTNFRRDNRAEPLALDDAAKADVARIEQAWRDARAKFGAGGPFLFGEFCAADAFFAPVVSRFEVYGAPLSADSRAYCQAIMALPAWKKWRAGAQAESWIIERWENL
jgi:glutathione S-transferase